ncbi:hypothetical protein [Pseudarthrobacter equi]|uniref:hypothetical protein n=1 Tax=Pseudarthrobacter equi TaxID=728066 RepID=UPI0028D33B59|nr:hypothetical protein [Pseudarthrobacter equi]
MDQQNNRAVPDEPAQGGQPHPDGTGGMNGGATGAPGGLGMGMAGLNAAIHSEYVILQGSSYVTMASQTGTVTDVSSDSLAVKSEDGFPRTYAVGADVQVSLATASGTAAAPGAGDNHQLTGRRHVRRRRGGLVQVVGSRKDR